MDFTRRIADIETTIARQNAVVEGAEWYAFRVAPSCPPDKRIYLRGGYCAAGYFGLAWRDYSHRTYTVPDMIADLTDPSSVTIDLAFTNANWYKFAILCLKLPAVLENPTVSDWSFHLHETGDEFETSAGAEAWFNSDTFRASHPWDGDTGYPLCGLVLKNNGTPGAGCPILPIDYVNRGRSYMWPTDIRPRKVVI